MTKKENKNLVLHVRLFGAMVPIASISTIDRKDDKNDKS